MHPYLNKLLCRIVLSFYYEWTDGGGNGGGDKQARGVKCEMATMIRLAQ